jgi:hypothetical protein
MLSPCEPLAVPEAVCVGVDVDVRPDDTVCVGDCEVVAAADLV